MTEEQVLRLGDVAEIVTGSTPSGTESDNWGTGAAFLTPSDMEGSDYNPQVSRRLSSAAEGRLASRIIEPTAVAVVCIGATIGKMALVRERTLTNQQINTIIPRSGILDPYYCYYAMHGLKSQLVSIATGSATPLLNKSRFSEVRLSVPPIEEQIRRASTLKCLDELIEANLGIMRDIRNLSGALLSNYLEEDYEAVPLKSIASVNPAKVSSPEPAKVYYLAIADVGDGTISWPPLADWETAPAAARLLAESGDVVWSRVRPNRRSHALIPSTSGGRIIVSTGMVVLRPKTVSAAYLMSVTDTHAFSNSLAALADGTAYPTVGPEVFTEITVPLIPEGSMQAFDEIMKPLWHSYGALDMEVRDLRQTRDELIPLITSGRVSVPSKGAA